MKFSGVCLITENVPALVAFYRRVFGCTAEGDNTHSELQVGGTSLAIFTRQGMQNMAPGCVDGMGYGNITLGFEVADVDEEYQRLQALDVPIVKPPATYPWGSRSVWFKDPDGNIVNFFSRVAV